MQERLQKIIAAAGLASRRHAEEMITAGEVMVNGKIVRELGTKADPAIGALLIAATKVEQDLIDARRQQASEQADQLLREAAVLRK